MRRGAIGDPGAWAGCDRDHASRRRDGADARTGVGARTLVRTGCTLSSRLCWACSDCSGLRQGLSRSVRALSTACPCCARAACPNASASPHWRRGPFPTSPSGVQSCTGRLSRYGLWAALIISLVYVVVGTSLVPRLWSDPLPDAQNLARVNAQPRWAGHPRGPLMDYFFVKFLHIIG